MITMMNVIPPNHPWHAIFVRTIHILHGLVDESIYSLPDWAEITWDGLGSLQYYWDFWDGVELQPPRSGLAGAQGPWIMCSPHTQGASICI